MSITRDSLMTLEAYAKHRRLHQGEVLAHRRLRSLTLGEHMSLQFEDERTVRYQIQEMLRIGRIFEEEGIRGELEAYLPLVPDGSNWKATLMLEYDDPLQRRHALALLVGVENRVFVEVEGQARVYAMADEDMPSDGAGRTSAVHLVRFELAPPMREALRAGAAVVVGCDHPHCIVHVPVPAATLASLAGDLH